MLIVLICVVIFLKSYICISFFNSLSLILITLSTKGSKHKLYERLARCHLALKQSDKAKMALTILKQLVNNEETKSMEAIESLLKEVALLDQTKISERSPKEQSLRWDSIFTITLMTISRSYSIKHTVSKKSLLNLKNDFKIFYFHEKLNGLNFFKKSLLLKRTERYKKSRPEHLNNRIL